MSRTGIGGGVSVVTEPLERVATALSLHVPLAGMVLVSARSPRVVWLERDRDVELVSALTERGRDVLAQSSDSTGGPDADGATLAIRLGDDEGVVRGVLFAIRTPGTRWSDAERLATRAAVDVLRPALLELAESRRSGERYHQLETQLRRAADSGELLLLYQPEIDLRTGRVIGVEALVRWDHPEHGRLGPDVFVQLAERSDLINVLGAWVIEEAICEFATFRDDDVVLRVNVSPAQLGGDGVVGRFADALGEHDVPGTRVCVEFTETSDSGEVAEFADTLRALAELGITTAMDDLATGYSTLSRLRTLPVDTVKIDRSLVSGIDSDPRARTIVSSLLQLAAALSLDVVVEGVETVAELHSLIALGCRRAQGHLLGRPQDASDIRALLRDGPIRLP